MEILDAPQKKQHVLNFFTHNRKKMKLTNIKQFLNRKKSSLTTDKLEKKIIKVRLLTECTLRREPFNKWENYVFTVLQCKVLVLWLKVQSLNKYITGQQHEQGISSFIQLLLLRLWQTETTKHIILSLSNISVFFYFNLLHGWQISDSLFGFHLCCSISTITRFSGLLLTSGVQVTQTYKVQTKILVNGTVGMTLKLMASPWFSQPLWKNIPLTYIMEGGIIKLKFERIFLPSANGAPSFVKFIFFFLAHVCCNASRNLQH